MNRPTPRPEVTAIRQILAGRKPDARTERLLRDIRQSPEPSPEDRARYIREMPRLPTRVLIVNEPRGSEVQNLLNGN